MLQAILRIDMPTVLIKVSPALTALPLPSRLVAIPRADGLALVIERGIGLDVISRPLRSTLLLVLPSLPYSLLN